MEYNIQNTTLGSSVAGSYLPETERAAQLSLPIPINGLRICLNRRSPLARPLSYPAQDTHLRPRQTPRRT